MTRPTSGDQPLLHLLVVPLACYQALHEKLLLGRLGAMEMSSLACLRHRADVTCLTDEKITRNCHTLTAISTSSRSLWHKHPLEATSGAQRGNAMSLTFHHAITYTRMTTRYRPRQLRLRHCWLRYEDQREHSDSRRCCEQASHVVA